MSKQEQTNSQKLHLIESILRIDDRLLLGKLQALIYLETEASKSTGSDNAYAPWSIADDQRLLDLHSEGNAIKELANIFGRKKGAIRSRLRKLNSKD
ncbi:MAG: hypothetical protein K9J06_10190 [Flavobacteriales bacterium]|nr:hypothetical protein [Flavobacteriales bacterium]